VKLRFSHGHQEPYDQHDAEHAICGDPVNEGAIRASFSTHRRARLLGRRTCALRRRDPLAGHKSLAISDAEARAAATAAQRSSIRAPGLFESA
jgi:hypothetical protein